MLDRRHLMRTGVTAAAGLLAVGPRPVRAAAQKLRIGYILPSQSQLGAGATVFANEVEKRTGGRITIQQFPDASLGGEVEMTKGLQLGSIDIAFITGLGLPSVVPAVGVFNIPFLFRGTAHAYAVFDGPIGDSYRKVFAAKDLVMLAWGENGLRHMTNAKHPIVVPDDLKGLKMRVPQSKVMLEAFKALGADAGPLPFPQVFEALRSGTFDGEENPIATIVAARFDEVQKFLTLSGHVYDPAVFLMSPDTFGELSDEDKASFLAAARQGAAASRQFAADAQTAGVGALQKAGMTVQRDIDRVRFAAAMAGANPAFEQQFGKDLIEQIRQAG